MRASLSSGKHNGLVTETGNLLPYRNWVNGLRGAAKSPSEEGPDALGGCLLDNPTVLSAEVVASDDHRAILTTVNVVKDAGGRIECDKFTLTLHCIPFRDAWAYADNPLLTDDGR
jgi:hypothetical protein